MHNSEIRAEVKRLKANLISPSLQDYKELMTYAIMEKHNDLVDHLLSVVSGEEINSIDYHLLAIATIRDNLYATRAIVRDHHVDPLDARLRAEYPHDIFEFETEEDEENDYGPKLAGEITKRSKYPIWGYVGFLLHTMFPPSMDLLKYLISSVSDPSTVVHIFDWKENDYSSHLETEIEEYYEESEDQVEYLIDTLGRNLTGAQIDVIFMNGLMNIGRNLYYFGDSFLALPNIDEVTQNKVCLLHALHFSNISKIREYRALVQPSDELIEAYNKHTDPSDEFL